MQNLNEFRNNLKLTENGSIAESSTLSKLLDLFGIIGSLRNRSEHEILNKFYEAYEENPLLAVKTLFHARRIRGGLGERRTFRIILKDLARKNPEVVEKNFEAIERFGRYDDFYSLMDTPVENSAFAYLKKIFDRDMAKAARGESITLLGKWLKSVNTSSRVSREQGRRTAKHFGLSEKVYRKSLRTLRTEIDLVEQKMSSKRWSLINYSAVPSYAMKNYRKAFSVRDGERFEGFLNKVKEGDSTIKAATLFPYDLVKTYTKVGGRCKEDEVIEAQWKALPSYLEEGKNVLVMADVSGSMSCNGGLPLATSVGLAIYFAERNLGAYAGTYMTFSSYPEFLTLEEGSLLEKVQKSLVNGGLSTNLEAAFERLLNNAIWNEVTAEDMPVSLIVISDMEIDRFKNQESFRFLDAMEDKFRKAGYELPQLVFWNVEARNDTFLGNKFDKRVQFFSGSSAATFKNVLDNIGVSAIDAMLNVLNAPEYNGIKI